VDFTNGDVPNARRLAAQLRQALTDHGRSTGRAWDANIRAIPRDEPLAKDSTDHAVRINLTAADVDALILILRTATQPKPGRRLSTNEVAARIGCKPATIRGWLKRDLPRDNPFPKPRKRLGRSEWDEAEIEAWAARQDPLRAGRPAAPGPASRE
jgi:predicted DNA-binding transcriptional regulator AlpA